MPYEVKVKELPPQQVAAVKRRTSMEAIGNTVQEGFAALMSAMGKTGLAPAGPPFIVYHSVIDQQSDGDIEICFPVAGPFEGEGDVYGAVVEGGSVASTVHRGSYDKVGAAYQTLTTWIQEHGHEVAGPSREVYLTDPQRTPDPADYVTEIVFPIR